MPYAASIVDTLFCLCLITTGYSPDMLQTDDTPHITASGDSVSTDTIALSRDLLKAFSPFGWFEYGDTVLVSTNCREGELRVVKDTMHARKSHQADLFYWTKKEALKHGRQLLCIRKVLRGHGHSQGHGEGHEPGASQAQHDEALAVPAEPPGTTRRD